MGHFLDLDDFLAAMPQAVSAQETLYFEA